MKWFKRNKKTISEPTTEALNLKDEAEQAHRKVIELTIEAEKVGAQLDNHLEKNHFNERLTLLLEGKGDK
jgi:hypothetical protein